MNRTRKKRLQKVSQQIDAMPIAPGAEEAAFERFRETGELPEHQRLAAAVVDRALQGSSSCRKVGPSSWEESIRILAEMAKGLAEPEPEPQPLRRWLFDEAVYGADFVRCAARGALKILVAIGGDVTDPNFLGVDTELPDYGSVGLHVLGFPECFAKPPYEDQTQRLCDRFESLRERIDRDDREWMDGFGEAAVLFLHEGELPDDELMCEAVLANGELMGVMRHCCGECDPEVMAVFDQVAQAKGADRAAAIARLQAMAAEGRLVSRDAFE